MPNDLEEFLRQAAAMRQQKTIEQRAEAERQREQQSRSRPQPYTNARQERLVDTARFDNADQDTVLGIEILEDKPSAGQSSQASSMDEHSAGTAHARRGAETDTSKTSLASELREMLARPDGVRQAFLIREILNRPRF